MFKNANFHTLVLSKFSLVTFAMATRGAEMNRDPVASIDFLSTSTQESDVARRNSSPGVSKCKLTDIVPSVEI